MLTNVSKLIHTEEGLEASEMKYRSLFDSIDEGFCTIEMLFDEHNKPIDYRFLEVNKAFERQTGIRNAAGKRMREIRTKARGALVPDLWRDCPGRERSNVSPRKRRH